MKFENLEKKGIEIWGEDFKRAEQPLKDYPKLEFRKTAWKCYEISYYTMQDYISFCIKNRIPIF